MVQYLGQHELQNLSYSECLLDRIQAAMPVCLGLAQVFEIWASIASFKLLFSSGYIHISIKDTNFLGLYFILYFDICSDTNLSLPKII